LITPEWQELTVIADLAEIDRVRDFLREKLRGSTVAEEDAMALELALHEIFVNVALHAYPEAKGRVTVRIRRDGENLHMEIRDRGIPFNPIEMPPIDLENKIRLGTRGGVGVYLFKTLMDGYSYRRGSDENILTIYKRLKIS
jgi:serine/threonine-protein kinase RsbW